MQTILKPPIIFFLLHFKRAFSDIKKSASPSESFSLNESVFTARKKCYLTHYTVQEVECSHVYEHAILSRQDVDSSMSGTPFRAASGTAHADNAFARGRN